MIDPPPCGCTRDANGEKKRCKTHRKKDKKKKKKKAKKAKKDEKKDNMINDDNSDRMYVLLLLLRLVDLGYSISRVTVDIRLLHYD